VGYEHSYRGRQCGFTKKHQSTKAPSCEKMVARHAMRRVAAHTPATVRSMSGGAVSNRTPPYKHMRGVVGAPSFSLRVS
jgi:hypothetical protein